MRNIDDVKIDVHMKPADIEDRMTNKPYYWVICLFSEDDMEWKDSSYDGWEETVDKAWEEAKKVYKNWVQQEIKGG